MIKMLFKVFSILVPASPSDDHFYKVWIFLRNIWIIDKIILGELKRHFEIYVVKIHWIIIIEFLLDKVSCNCGVLSLLQLDEFQ